MEKGALRQKVLWLVQENGPVSAVDVCALLRQERDISLNAVQTVLNRLVKEGLLVRHGARRHYVYEAHPTEEVAKQKAARAAIDLISQSGDIGLAHFVETIDQLRPEMTDKLQQLLAARRGREKHS